MDPLTRLSAEFDPLRPLEAGETDLYVDWQNQLDIADDVKVRLANSIARSPGPVTRLFTGHRGAGKTTELNRVRQRLQLVWAGAGCSCRCCLPSAGCTSTTSSRRTWSFRSSAS